MGRWVDRRLGLGVPREEGGFKSPNLDKPASAGLSFIGSISVLLNLNRRFMFVSVCKMLTV